MAYEGGYGGQQRSYGGPAPQRHAPRQHGGAPPQQYGAPQQYDDYQGGNGYDDFDGGYGQDYGGQYQDHNYGRGPPPPQDQYGPGPGRGGRPMPGGRGGPVPRPQTADPHRGRPHPPRGGMGPGPGRPTPNGPPGRGGMRPGPYGANSDPAARQLPTNTPPISPRDANFGNPYPPFQGKGRRTDLDLEQQITDQMSGMDLNHKPRMQANGRPSLDSQRSQGDYGRQPMNGGHGPPPRGYQQGYQDSRGPPPRQDPGYGGQGGYGGYDDGYGGGQGPPSNGFGPPARSRTMPVEDMRSRNNMPPPPQRMNTMQQHSTPAGRGIPQRPSTAGGHRPPPQRSYTANPQGAQGGQYGDGYDDGHFRKESTASYDDVYDSYFDNQRDGNPEYGAQQQQNRTSFPDFDAAPPAAQRGSFEQSMRPGGMEQPQRGAHQTAVLNHAKSQPDLRQPQAAVFEMAGDVPDLPPMPPVPQMNNYQTGYDQDYHGSGGYDQMPPRGPSAPPAAMNGSRNGGPMNPDSLPSHPAPVRPGLMQDSMVNLNSKPAPQQSPPRSNGARPSGRDEGPVTTQELEHLRMVIKTDASDQASALKLAKRLVEAADVLAPKMPDPKQRARARERYLIDCHKILKKLSNAQNPDAMFFLADCVGRGLFGHEPDHKEAFTQYQSAAKLGHPAAAYRTAVCCEIGHEDGGGTRKDPMKAIQWYKRAATLGDPPAMYKVGMILLKGLLGQPKNPREAVGWLKRAAERADADNPHALHELGLLYESAQPNDVIIRDETYAHSLFLQAADLGYKFSQYRLGCAFEYGLLGCPIDPRQSIMWYSKAATQEEHQAELALSGWYLTGSENVLGQSDTEAYLWARKAAIAGLAKAEYAMGYFTEVGIGVPPNLEDAKRWYWRAAAQDFPKARERLEDLKRAGKNGVRQRERISRSKIERQQEGDCTVM
ncbi:hypothetical protein ACJZ2D_003800 [Fusarium nematophilum]